MKFKVSMKCPDALDKAIENACDREVVGPEDSEELDIAYNDLVRKTENLCQKWFKYGEYLTVEIDTEQETCEVCPS